MRWPSWWYAETELTPLARATLEGQRREYERVLHERTCQRAVNQDACRHLGGKGLEVALARQMAQAIQGALDRRLAIGESMHLASDDEFGGSSPV